ncbi:site-specific integrase [Herminiimonas sp. CN]|uniref:tyrosine-type recombinase/integrase n=1 Tax=Herminiimonas sp. CN TaxID=1349818 RepID=UPI00047384FF|nr:site-specific integrase [Herminiimonas sp. CN]
MKWENFTAGRVTAFKCEAGKKQSIFWDGKTPGLGLRVTAAGAKSYIFETSLNGKTLRITIGDAATYAIAAAQAEAANYKAQTNKGIDPRQVKADAKVATQARAAEAEAKLTRDAREMLTLGLVWPLHVESRRKRWSEWHIRDHENVVRVGGVQKIRGKGLTEPGPLASLLGVRLSDLSGQRIGEWLAKEAETRPTQAALSFRLLSVFVNWCNSQSEYAGLVPAGACKAQQVRDEMPGKKAKEGDSLQREQLALWFKAVREMGNPVQSAYLQALLLTGARRRELGALRWDDVDFQWLSMTIRDKVEGERTIPLTPYVAQLLAALPRRNEWVFSSPAAANGRLAEPTPGHKRALVAAGLPDLTLHGLRRSFGSLAEWTETPAGVVAQIMGHKPSAIAEKHYRRRPLDLLRMWHVKIEGWILEQAGIDFVPVAPGLRTIK